jgi:hypothetical protein
MATVSSLMSRVADRMSTDEDSRKRANVSRSWSRKPETQTLSFRSLLCPVSSRKNRVKALGSGRIAETGPSPQTNARQAEHTLAPFTNKFFKNTEVKGPKRCRGLAPHLRRRFNDSCELAPHLFFAHHFGVNAAEAALRAKRKLIRRQIPACLIDASLELINGL